MIDIDPDEAYRNEVKLNYEFSSWAGQTKVGDNNVRLSDVRFQPEDLPGSTMEEKEELRPSARQKQVVRYIHSFSSAGAGGTQRLVTTVFECNSVIEAHESLIDVVMTYMAPNLPRCETKGLEIGDICFGSHGEVNISVIFARFNILVEIKSTTPGPASVDEFARNVDSFILRQYSQTK